MTIRHIPLCQGGSRVVSRHRELLPPVTRWDSDVGARMAARGSSGRILAISSLLSLVVPIVVPFGNAALARQAHATHGRTHAEAVAAQHGPGYPSTAHARGIPVYYGAAYGRAGRHARFAPRPLSFRRGGGLQCVTFARGESGIELSGNATDWWDNAAGIYQRGNRPEMGSVLNFRSNPRMRLGHVAVVTNVIDQRQIEIDQANWSGPGIYSGGVSRSIRVVDVSPANDWTAVRVELGHTEDFGSVYPDLRLHL